MYSVARNTYHSPTSCFIVFLLLKMKEISLDSFFKSCNYELSFWNSIRFKFFTTGCKKCLKKTLVMSVSNKLRCSQAWNRNPAHSHLSILSKGCVKDFWKKHSPLFELSSSKSSKFHTKILVS